MNSFIVLLKLLTNYIILIYLQDRSEVFFIINLSYFSCFFSQVEILVLRNWFLIESCSCLSGEESLRNFAFFFEATDSKVEGIPCNFEATGQDYFDISKKGRLLSSQVTSHQKIPISTVFGG